uniref:nuclear pore-associated protein 1-like n=1 Tax=Nyctereutes procyonoides TaxID=34880 RepID=UPI002443D3EF|nr:nuclear pore-associated protein 1-like [Nyctereutes procyonoides]
MGHLFSKFLRPPRRRPLSGRSRPLVTPACDTAHAGRDHPAAPAPAACSGRRPFQRARRPVPARCHGEPGRRHPLPQAAGPPLGLLPAVSWRSPPGGRALPARSSLVLRPSRTARIPPPVRKVALLHSLPAQVARAASQVPCPPLPASIPQGMEEEVPEHPAGQREAPAEAKGPDGGSGRPHSRGDTQGTCERPETSGVLSLHRASPAPLDRRLSPSGESSWHSTQMSPVSSSEGRAATSSCGPAGDGLGKADRDAAVLPGPRPCCPLPQETSAEEAATENHQPVQSVRDASRKDPQAEEPSGVSPRSRGPPAPASSGRNKRKLGMPLCLPLPPPLPLLWDRGDVPPPPKLPCVAVDKDLGTVQNTERPRNRTLKRRTKTLADCRAAQPAPACPPLAWDTAGSAPLAAPAAQVPVPPTAAAEPSAGPPILSVPPSSPTQQGGPETGHGGPKSPPLAVPADSLPPLTSSPTGETPPRGGPLPPGSAAAPASDRPPPPNTSTSLHPASCTKESPAPMCVDSPPLSRTTPRPGHCTDSSVGVVQPGTSKPTSSTIAAKSSTLTPKPISNPGVVDMDTTPPSRAVIFSTSPHCRMSCPPFSRGRGSTTQRCPAKVAASTSPPTSVAPGPTPLLHQLFGLQVTPQPTHGTLAGRQQTAFLPSAPIATGLPNLSSGATTTPVGSTSANLNAHSDPDAMDTTSPSRAVVFHSHPGSRKNHLSFYKALPGSGNTPPTSSTALGHGSTNLPQKSASIQTPVPKHSNAGIVTGGHSGQQPNNSYLLGKTVAPTQAVGLAPPITHPPGGSTMQAAFGGSPFGTTVNKQTAFGNQPGILHTPHSTTTGFGGPTGNTSTSLTATMTGTQSFVWSVVPSGPPLTASTIGPQTFVWSVVPSGPPLTVNTTVPATTTVLKSTRALPGHTTSAVVASTSTVISVLRCTSSSTFLPGTRGPPAQRVSGVKEGNNITPKTGRPGIPALCQHNGGPPDANTDETLIVSMMAALCISNRPRNPGGLPVSKATGATGNSTIPAVTGQNSGPPFLQSTQNPPKPQHWWCHGGHHHAS